MNHKYWDKGKDLIERMKANKNNPWWMTTDLIHFIESGKSLLYDDAPSKKRTISSCDPQMQELCITLNGTFSIAEIEAIYIAKIHERGEWRG